MISVSNELNEARLAGVLAFLDTGSGPASILIYGTTRPANGAAAGGAALVEIELEDPAGTVDAGALELSAAADALIASTGTATWARVVNADGDHAFDCDVSAEGEGGEVELSTVNLYAGGLVRLMSAILG